MKPEDIKVGMELWAFSGTSVYPIGTVNNMGETPFGAWVSGTLNQAFANDLYPSKEAAERALKISQSPWRTDFENMPKDGTAVDFVLTNGQRGEARCEGDWWKVLIPGASGVLRLRVSQEAYSLACWMPIPDFSMFLEGDE